jgi:multidrug efflux system outer membrane protein
VAGPIYTGGGLTAAVGQATARWELSLASYESYRNAFRDVRIRSPICAKAPSFARPCGDGSHPAARGRARQRRYENGYSDYLEVLDTERSLFSAELQLASARGDYQRALVSLYLALGGDWTTLPPTASSPPQNGGSNR